MAETQILIQFKNSLVSFIDELIEAFYVNRGIDYNTANKTFKKTKEFFERADNLLENLLTYLEENVYTTEI